MRRATPRSGGLIASRTAVLLLELAALAGLPATGTPANAQTLAPPSPPPNMIIITVDGLGYADAGFNGAAGDPTPNIDRLADEGVVFTNGYTVQPGSSASQAGLLTARYPSRFGQEEDFGYAPFDINHGVDYLERTFVRRLKRIRFRTAMVGKWHLGAQEWFIPRRRGFGYFFGFLGPGHDYRTSDANALTDEYRLPLIEDSDAVDLDGYLTDVLTDKAIAFVDAQADGEDPFLLYLAYNAPGPPLQAPALNLAGRTGIADEARATYLAMVDALDANVGRLLDAIGNAGVKDHTLIFFVGERGAASPGANGSLRGGRGTLYEGGIRVPFVASWPNRWPRDATFDGPVATIDIGATAMTMAGLTNVSVSRPPDGVNLDPYVRGEQTGAPHAALYWRRAMDGGYAVRSGDMKLVRQSGAGPVQLFNLADDRAEATNVLSDNAATANRLGALWNAWNKDNAPGTEFGDRAGYEHKLKGFADGFAADAAANFERQRFSIAPIQGDGT